MSVGGFSGALSAAAAFVLRSLMEHPDFQTPEEIADAPHAPDDIDDETAGAALRELEQHGLTAEAADGRGVGPTQAAKPDSALSSRPADGPRLPSTAHKGRFALVVAYRGVHGRTHAARS